MYYQNGFRLVRFLLLLFCFSCLSYLLCIDHSQEMSPNAIIGQLKSAPIPLKVIQSALPRLDEEDMVLRLRGGDREFFRGYRAAKEDTLRKCFIIGATFTAANWEWCYMQRFIHEQDIVNGLTAPIEQNLSTTNHELRSFGAPVELLNEIDHLKRNFEASGTDKLDIAEINRTFEQVIKELKWFLKLKNLGEQSFGLGEWFVYEAELSNLCLSMDSQYASHFISVMNQRYRLVNRIDLRTVYQKLFHTEPDTQQIPFLYSQFPINDLAGVKKVHSTVTDIFRLLDIRFPKLG